jgi:arsenate reductase
MNPIKVLFVCIHNSARSQMAEAFLNQLGKGKFIAESAGLEPGKLNPIVVEAMKSAGIDISHNQTKTVDEMIARGNKYSYVITVCDESNAERCPLFPGVLKTIHWSFEDPSAITGSFEEKINKTKIIRDKIRIRIESWLHETTPKEDL